MVEEPPPPPITGEQYGKWNRNTLRVVNARMFYVLRNL